MVAKRLALVQDLQLALKPLLQLLMNKSKMLPTEEELFDESDIAVTRLCLAIENCFFDGLKVMSRARVCQDESNFRFGWYRIASALYVWMCVCVYSHRSPKKAKINQIFWVSSNTWLKWTRRRSAWLFSSSRYQPQPAPPVPHYTLGLGLVLRRWATWRPSAGCVGRGSDDCSTKTHFVLICWWTYSIYLL